MAYKFSYELSQLGITVASGLAVGIDTFAHLGSYNQKGKTIAVLGCGFNQIFPNENIGLYKKILDNDGLIISEYPPDARHQSKYFLQRNRIVSGLSLGVLVIEATFRSGTSVTARLATLQGRKVFAVPHEIWNSHGVGTNRLIKNDAIMVTETNDILLEFDNLKGLTTNDIKMVDLPNFSIKLNDFNIHPYNSNCGLHVLNIDSSNNDLQISNIDSLNNDLQVSNINILNNDLQVSNAIFKSSKSLEKKICKDSKLQCVYDLISTTPISINEICKKTSKSISDVSNILFSLELEGYIKKVAGGYVCILNN